MFSAKLFVRTLDRRPPFGRWLASLLILCTPLVLAGSIGAQDPAPKKQPLITETPDTFLSGKAEIRVLRFEQQGDGKRPVLVFLHGCEGWSNRDAYRTIAKSLARQGYVVILICYFDRTGTPDNVPAAQRAAFIRWLQGAAAGEKENVARKRFEQWIETVGDAVAYARQLPNVDGQRVGLVGFSLGGYLAVSAAMQKQFEITTLVELFGGLPEELRKNVKTMPATLILHGEQDNVVPVKEGYALLGLLIEKKQPVEFEFYPGVGHCFIRPGQNEPDMWVAWSALNRATAFLGKHLKAVAGKAAERSVASEGGK
jgi:dienelactone hydrolase